MLILRASVLAVVLGGVSLLAAAGPVAAQSYRSAPGSSVDVPELVGRLLPSVVNISTVRYEAQAAGASNTPSARRRALGSGFVIDPAGVILTNRHVIENADEITVTFTDGTSLGATVIATAVIDIALLRVMPAKPLPAVKWGNSFELRQGQPVIAIGNPLGYTSTVTMGIISAMDRDIASSPFDDYIQTDASVNPGNSGGPLFNLAGEVIGVNTAISTTSDTSGSIGIAFAIPSNDAQFVVTRLTQFERIRAGWLALKVQKTSVAVAEAVGLPSARGVIVTGVDPANVPLGEAIWPGDVILDVDGVEVHDVRTFNRAVGEQHVGSIAPLTVWRDGRRMAIKVMIEDNPEDIRRGAGRPVRTVQASADGGPDLGLNLASLTPEARKRLKMTDEQPGLVLVHVEPFSPAAEQGLLAGDAILKVARLPVRSVRDFWTKMEQARAEGRPKTLLLIRNENGDRWIALPTG